MQAQIIHWPSAVDNDATIASLQSLAAAGDLALNFSLSNAQTSRDAAFVYNNMARTVGLTSANNLAGVNFTVTGLGSAVDASGNPTQPLNTPISEVIAGPNANTVYTTHIFTSITNIATSAAAAAVSAGFGDSGIIGYIFPDYNKIFWGLSATMQVIAQATLTYEVYVSLNKPEYPDPIYGKFDPFAPLLLTPPVGVPAFPVTATTTVAANNLYYLPSPVAMIWATVAANTTIHEEAYFTVLQQGLRS